MNTLQVSNLVRARALLDQVRAVLAAYPNVVGLSVGLRDREEVSTGEVAFVVFVDHKHQPQHVNDTLPRSLFGIPVDVQEAPKSRLVASVSGGGNIKRSNAAEEGRIGFAARDAQHVYVLTVLHVLITEREAVTIRPGQGPQFNVEARSFDTDFEVVGKLYAGEFDRDCDVACVRIDSSHTVRPELFNTPTKLLAPIEPTALPVGCLAQMVVPGHAPVDALFLNYPYANLFETETGTRHFTNLLRFRVNVDEIPDGWSGSVIFEPQERRPLALLSFASHPDAHGRVYAYGFPLAAHYQLWGLSPL